ncbi:MAG: hypothetical protein V5A38_12240 [Halolamina sp.]|uniref:hypothetical protein n=1 Tax=Halolamina sp. TaxID=1940283 RepID=UPI002FC2AC71
MNRFAVITITTVLFWGPLLFAVMVAASYVGTKLALRSYHEGIDPKPSEIIGIDDEGRRD